MINNDGEIAGLLCRSLPLCGASRSIPLTQDQCSAIIDEAAHNSAKLLATIDCGLWLLRRQTEVEGRRLVVGRMRHSIRRGAASNRKFLGGNRIQQSGHADATRRSLHTKMAQDLSYFVADPENLYVALLRLSRNASAALQHCGEVGLSANNSAQPGPSSRAGQIIDAGNRSGKTHGVLRRAFDSDFTTNVGNVRVSVSGQVQQFIQKSSGAIEIRSEVGVGRAVRVMQQPVSGPVDDNSVEQAKFCCNIRGPRK